MKSRILNFGSVNIDRVYRTTAFVRPGETIRAKSFEVFPGGKGFNQSTALARAGAAVWHAGCIGADGAWLRDALAEDGVDISLLRTVGGSTGHAAIEVDDSGQNRIIIDGGANRLISPDFVEEAVSRFSEGDILLVQNEVSCISEIIDAAYGRSMKVVFNPAPMDRGVLDYPLGKVSLFVVNEHEGAALGGVASSAPEDILGAMKARFPEADVVITLGSRGSIGKFGIGDAIFVEAEKVEAVDTTAAGDTYIGYLLAHLASGAEPAAAMRIAAHAAAICVTKPGAAPSIPIIRN